MNSCILMTAIHWQLVRCDGSHRFILQECEKYINYHIIEETNATQRFHVAIMHSDVIYHHDMRIMPRGSVNFVHIDENT